MSQRGRRIEQKLILTFQLERLDEINPQIGEKREAKRL